MAAQYGKKGEKYEIHGSVSPASSAADRRGLYRGTGAWGRCAAVLAGRRHAVYRFASWDFLSARSGTFGGTGPGAGTIKEALRRAYRRESALLTGAEAFLRVILALALLFEPLEKFVPHIMLLGLELVLVNVRLPKEKPETAEHK